MPHIPEKTRYIPENTSTNQAGRRTNLRNLPLIPRNMR